MRYFLKRKCKMPLASTVKKDKYRADIVGALRYEKQDKKCLKDYRVKKPGSKTCVHKTQKKLIHKMMYDEGKHRRDPVTGRFVKKS